MTAGGEVVGWDVTTQPWQGTALPLLTEKFIPLVQWGIKTRQEDQRAWHMPPGKRRIQKLSKNMLNMFLRPSDPSLHIQSIKMYGVRIHSREQMEGNHVDLMSRLSASLYSLLKYSLYQVCFAVMNNNVF